MKKILFLAIMAGFILAGCISQTPANTNQQSTTGISAGLANPAAVYCEEQGGELENKTDQYGVYGVCVFPDGSKCDQWAYFRGACRPGTNITVFIPRKDNNVNLPIKIVGNARVFEKTVNLRLKEKTTGKILYSGFTISKSPDMGVFGEFEAEISELNQKPSGQKIILEVFWLAPKDGAETDSVSIPLNLTY